MSQYAIDNLAPTEQAVIESYMSPGGQVDSSLILQQAQQADTAPRITGIENVSFNPIAGYNLENFSFDITAVAIFSDGFKKVVVNNEGVILISQSDGLEYELNDYNDLPAFLSMTSLNGSPSILLSEVQAAGWLLHDLNE